MVKEQQEQKENKEKIEIKDFLKKYQLPLKMAKQFNLSIDENFRQELDEKAKYLLNMSIKNKNGVIDIYSIPLSQDLKTLELVDSDRFNQDLNQEKTKYKKNKHFILNYKNEDDNSSYFLGSQTLNFNDEKEKILFFCLNPLDYLALNALGVDNVISPPKNFLDDNSSFFMNLSNKVNLKDIEKIYLLIPDIENKQEVENVIGNRFDKSKCYKVNILNTFINYQDIPKSVKNLCEIMPYIDDKEENKLHSFRVKELLEEKSEPFPIDGIYQMNAFEEEIENYFIYGVKTGESTGWDCLDNYFKPKTKHVTLVSGIPQHGKSLFVKNLCYNLAKKSNWKTVFYAFEDESPESFYHSMLELVLCKNTMLSQNMENNEKEIKKNTAYVKSELFSKAKEFVKKYFILTLPDERVEAKENFLDVLLELFEIAILRYGIKNVVIDPWNQVVQSKDLNVNDSDFLSMLLGKVNRFAKKFDVHVFIVAHPKIMNKQQDDGEYRMPTIYDVNGGAAWFNKVSNGIIVYRNVLAKNGVNRILTVSVQKIKDRSMGRLGKTYLVKGHENNLLYDQINANDYEKRLARGENFNTGDVLKQQNKSKVISVTQSETDVPFD